MRRRHLLQALPAASPVRLHPNLPEPYRRKVMELRSALDDESNP